MKTYDVLVIGAGHAGVEAAVASDRIGAKTGLISFKKSDLGVMSCNPAMGGLGKGHLVREIDALDGIMARAIDVSGIQFRMLNRSRGPAVHGPRSQADRKLYKKAILDILESHENLTILEATVKDLTINNNEIKDVEIDKATVEQEKLPEEWRAKFEPSVADLSALKKSIDDVSISLYEIFENETDDGETEFEIQFWEDEANKMSIALELFFKRIGEDGFVYIYKSNGEIDEWKFN